MRRPIDLVDGKPAGGREKLGGESWGRESWGRTGRESWGRTGRIRFRTPQIDHGKSRSWNDRRPQPSSQQWMPRRAVRAHGSVVAPIRWRNSVRRPAAPLGVAEALPPVFEAIGFQAILQGMAFVYRVPEHPVVPFETLDVIG